MVTIRCSKAAQPVGSPAAREGAAPPEHGLWSLNRPLTYIFHILNAGDSDQAVAYRYHSL